MLLLLLLSHFITLCDPIDGSPPGFPVPGILQARILEWVAISFSNARKWKVKVKSLSRVRLAATPWTAAYQAPLSMGFARQEYWSGVPLPCTMDKGKYSKWAIIILLYSRHLLIPMQAREICMCAVLSLFSHIWLFAPPWTVALQDPLSMGFSRQKYWSGFPCSTPGDRKS